MSFKPDYPCSNPACASYGHIHPNCKCSPPGNYAEGGSVCTSNLAHDSSCEHFAEGDLVQSNHEFASNPDLAIDHSVAKHGLLHTLERSGYTKSEAPGRAHQEFLDAHRQGRKHIHAHTKALVEPKSEDYKPDENRAEALQSKLDELRANPDKALNIGGDLADHTPMHHALLAAKAANAMTYLQSIKPKPSQGGPLDTLMPPSKLDVKAYQRQVAIAEDPKLVFKYIKDGSVVPEDLATLQNLYPKLKSSMADRAFEQLAEAQASGRKLTHRQKRKLGVLTGQPVLLQQSPAAIAAIMHANAPAQMPQAPQKGGPKKATATELRQIDKVTKLYQTPLERLQTSLK